MIAKIISHSGSREEAIDGLLDTLSGVQIWPIKTNAAFLRKVVGHPDFLAANIDTGFITQHEDVLLRSDDPSDEAWSAAARFALAEHTPEAAFLPTGFRLNGTSRMAVTLKNGVEIRTIDDRNDTILMHSDFGDPKVLAGEGEIADVFEGMVTPDRVVVFSNGNAIGFERTTRSSSQASASDGAILSPMPGKIIAVSVGQGDTVAKGHKLVTLEAMKMEHSLVAPFDGTVAELNAEAGGQVSEGTLLVQIEAVDG